MSKEIIIKEIVKIIRDFLPGSYKIFLFGSWAKGNALETSDIDVGILGKKEISWSIMVKILEKVEEISTLKSIDIVDLNSVEDSFKDNALKYATVLS